MTEPQQQNPNELLSITREELDRCCSQMSAAGYKVSANYVEASVLSRSRPAPSPNCVKCLEEDRVTMLEHDAAVAAQASEDMLPLIHELRNALIVAANNAHRRKKLVNECNPQHMFPNELQFKSLVEYALNKSKEFKADYESDTALDWRRE